MGKKKKGVGFVIFEIIVVILCVGALVSAFKTKEEDKLPDIKIEVTDESSDYEKVAYIINQDLRLNEFFFGGKIPTESNSEKMYEGNIYAKVNLNKSEFKSLNEITLLTREIYSSSVMFDFYDFYPKGRAPMFKDFSGELYVNLAYTEKITPDDFLKKVTPEQIKFEVINNIYADAVVSVNGVEYLFPLEKTGAKWMLNAMSWKLYADDANGVVKLM